MRKLDGSVARSIMLKTQLGSPGIWPRRLNRVRKCQISDPEPVLPRSHI